MHRLIAFSICISIQEIRITLNDRTFAWDFPLWFTGLHRTPIHLPYKKKLPRNYGEALECLNIAHFRTFGIGDRRFAFFIASMPIRSPYRFWTRRVKPFLHVYEMDKDMVFEKLLGKVISYAPVLHHAKAVEIAERYVRGIPALQ